MEELHGFYSIDLEMEQPSDEIISIGIAWNEYSDGFLLTHSKDFLITPSQPISEFIRNLTGLDDSMYDWNKTRKTCFEEFISFYNTLHLKHKNAIVWGMGDIPLLRKELNSEGLFSPISRRFTDVKVLLTMDKFYNGRSLSQKSSLKSALVLYGIKSTGTAHNSADDAHNTLLLFNQFCEKQIEIRRTIEKLKGLV